MRKIGLRSFGHRSDVYGSEVRPAADSLLQSIELAVAAEELGADGAYFRVHHFARQLGSPRTPEETKRADGSGDKAHKGPLPWARFTHSFGGSRYLTRLATSSSLANSATCRVNLISSADTTLPV